MRKIWWEAIKDVWDRYWELILVLIGLITTLSTAPSPTWVQILNSLLAIALAVRLYREFGQALRIRKVKHIPIVVVIGKGDDVAASCWQDAMNAMERWDFDSERYRRDFDVEKEDLLIHLDEPLPPKPDEWLKVVSKFRKRLERLNRRLPGRRVYHLFINGPIALGVGLGAGMGTMFEVVIHHWAPGSGEMPYYPAIDFYSLSERNRRGMHIIEDPVSGEFKYIRTEGESKGAKELYTSIWMARDDPRPAVEELVAQKIREGESAESLHIVQLEQRSLTPEDDWILCAREILTCLHNFTAGRERSHLFLSVPMPLAVAIGLGLEHFKPITVYSWWPQEKKFYPVLDLDRLGRTAV